MPRFHQRRLTPPIEEPSVNLTPLIDVVFVILIMFILVAPLLEVDRIELADGPSDKLEASIEVHETSPITLHVHRDNTIWLNSRKITLDQLPRLLSEAKKKYPKARPQLFHDRKAHFGTYQTVKNAAEQAGFSEMDILLKPG